MSREDAYDQLANETVNVYQKWTGLYVYALTNRDFITSDKIKAVTKDGSLAPLNQSVTE